MPARVIKVATLIVVTLLFTLTIFSWQTPPAPPSQPATGPGGKQASHGSVTKNRYGKAGEEYWLFEPADPNLRARPSLCFCTVGVG
jgi:hypothetical protein